MCRKESSRRRALRLSGVVALSCSIALFACDSSDDPPPVDASRTYAPSESPLGLSHGNWGAAWWRWALNIPAATNPLLDDTGAACAAGQDGEVWFLVGGLGGPPVERTCTIPAGKNVFFPILNGFLCVDPGDPSVDTIDKVRSLLNFGFLNSSMSVVLDGTPVPDPAAYRGTSDAFTLSLLDGNLLGAPPMDVPNCLSDGYWMMLKPLAAGPHTLHFEGTTPSDGFSLSVTYHLTSAP